MIKKLIGLLATFLTIVVMVYVILNRGSYRSMLPESSVQNEVVSMEESFDFEESAPAELVDSLQRSAIDTLHNP